MEQLANVTTSITRWMHRRDNDDARPLRRPSSLSSPGRHQTPSSHVECRSEICRYFKALEWSLLWEDSYSTFVNIYVFILFNAAVWAYNGLRVPIGMPQISFGITVHFIIQMMIVYKFTDVLAPTYNHPRPCSRLHSVWKRLRQLRNQQREIYSFLLCSLALCVWLFDRICSSSNRYMIYWSIIFAPPVLRLPLKISEMITTYLRSHGDWRYIRYDSDIEDEFLPVVTEANLQVLNRVGETGDRSPTPIHALFQDFDGPFNDEDLLEGLDIIPSHEDGSTDGVELSELELSVSENDAEETDIKFQSRHFEKTSSSSSEEDVFDSNKIIAASSDESNSDSDFEIIDKEEVARINI